MQGIGGTGAKLIVGREHQWVALACRLHSCSDKRVKLRRFPPPETFPPVIVCRSASQRALRECLTWQQFLLHAYTSMDRPDWSFARGRKRPQIVLHPSIRCPLSRTEPQTKRSIGT